MLFLRILLGLTAVGVFGEDRIRWARPRAELAADARLQPIWIPVELMPAVIVRRRRTRLLRILLCLRLFEHRHKVTAKSAIASKNSVGALLGGQRRYGECAGFGRLLGNFVYTSGPQRTPQRDCEDQRHHDADCDERGGPPAVAV